MNKLKSRKYKMRVVFSTNLDMYKRCTWPIIDCIPPVGTTISPLGYHNKLEVKSVHIKHGTSSVNYRETVVEVDLHYQVIGSTPNTKAYCGMWKTLGEAIDKDKLRSI
jgi:hypothetical protein